MSSSVLSVSSNDRREWVVEKFSGNGIKRIQILTTLNQSNRIQKMDTEAIGQMGSIGRVEEYIQSELSTPFDRPSLTAS